MSEARIEAQYTDARGARSSEPGAATAAAAARRPPWWASPARRRALLAVAPVVGRLTGTVHRLVPLLPIRPVIEHGGDGAPDLVAVIAAAREEGVEPATLRPGVEPAERPEPLPCQSLGGGGLVHLLLAPDLSHRLVGRLAVDASAGELLADAAARCTRPQRLRARQRARVRPVVHQPLLHQAGDGRLGTRRLDALLHQAAPQLGGRARPEVEEVERAIVGGEQ